MQTLLTKLSASGACLSAMNWVKENNITTADELWTKCNDVQWLFWGILRIRNGLTVTETFQYKDKLLDLVADLLPGCCKEIVDITKKAAVCTTDDLVWDNRLAIEAVRQLHLRDLRLGAQWAVRAAVLDLTNHWANYFKLSELATHVVTANAFTSRPLGKTVIPDIVRGLFPDVLEKFKKW